MSILLHKHEWYALKYLLVPQHGNNFIWESGDMYINSQTNVNILVVRTPSAVLFLFCRDSLNFTIYYLQSGYFLLLSSEHWSVLSGYPKVIKVNQIFYNLRFKIFLIIFKTAFANLRSFKDFTNLSCNRPNCF